MIHMIDITRECSDGRPGHRDLWGVGILAAHRIWYDDWSLSDLGKRSPIEIARRLVDDPELTKYTGGQTAYTHLVDPAGTWWQCLPLSDVGQHAARWNTRALGIGVIGDFRRHQPTPAQRAALVDGLALHARALEIPVFGEFDRDGRPLKGIFGHDELPGGSSDPTKRCPGKFLNMDGVRRDVADVCAEEARAKLLSMGVVP